MITVRRHYGVACALQAKPLLARRWASSLSSDLLARPVQSYISTSHDPYVNLSIEHHLLQKADPGSAILFLYVNRPSIIIGRNQNPWLEVDLALLQPSPTQPQPAEHNLGSVDLVRRRSGGGTVFHDEGNVNWTVISPSAAFTRDKHAEMVVRGLRQCGIDRARVNERHDIVLDQGEKGRQPAAGDTHATAYQSIDGGSPRPLKVSGSAYKLTRNRALHHGTCLLSSPNLGIIPRYLHSPAKPFITARGVESVSSPVGNILLSNEDFIAAVQGEFAKQYQVPSRIEPIQLGSECLDEKDVRKGFEELMSREWTFLQTPQFTISTESVDALDVDIDLTVRYGAITGGTISPRAIRGGESSQVIDLDDDLLGQRLHEIDSWTSLLESSANTRDYAHSGLSRWLQKMMPRV